MTTMATIDAAGGQTGGAARFRMEVNAYLRRSRRHDIKVIGVRRRLTPAWLAAREAAAVRGSRRVALNNVGFLMPGGERWTLLGNALHFLTEGETAALEPGHRARKSRQIPIVRQAALRSDVLIAPSTAMAERIATVLPSVADRIVVRPHPATANPGVARAGGSLILCPVIFASYKHMPDRLAEWVAAVDHVLDDGVRMLVTATAEEVPASLATSTRLHFVGRLAHDRLRSLWARSRAVYFPPGLESYGWPLAEARVNGQPIIARDTPQNREIAGPALCGYEVSDLDSLRHATETALAVEVAPDPAPFDPDAYFDWMLGDSK
jgi:glycosyltransferase involved in cell wall biosynthesis